MLAVSGEGKTALSVRRTTLSVPFYRYTLKHLSADLQKLFAEDLKDYTVNSHAYVVSYGATVDDGIRSKNAD